MFTQCNNACSPGWKPQVQDSLSPGPPSLEGMISFGDPQRPWAGLSSVCSRSEFFSFTCMKNVPKTCS